MFQALRAKLIITEVKFKDGNHMSGVKGFTEIHAARWGNAVDFELEILDCFGSFHVFANILESFVIGFEIGENDDLKVFVTALL